MLQSAFDKGDVYDHVYPRVVHNSLGQNIKMRNCYVRKATGKMPVFNPIGSKRCSKVLELLKGVLGIILSDVGYLASITSELGRKSVLLRHRKKDIRSNTQKYSSK